MTELHAQAEIDRLRTAKHNAEVALRELEQAYWAMTFTYEYGDKRIERERARARGARTAAELIHFHQTEKLAWARARSRP